MPLTRQQRRAIARRQKEGKPEPDRMRYMPREPDVTTDEGRRKAQQAVAALMALAQGAVR